MNNQYPFITHQSPPQNLAEKYCSCLFKGDPVYLNSQDVNSSLCFYTRKYLRGQTYLTLIRYAINKELIDIDEDISFDELVDIIATFLDSEERLYPENMHAVPQCTNHSHHYNPHKNRFEYYLECQQS